ncbi:hypothetical protein M5X00_04475 [Paenibacillus alvei]|uniref:hypothetical protein n=1 Tax=Paenibacillus alvei TaxID=44250 RepID=UPI000287B6A0|nr:hypothetical protein [Paenibacillus alvei]EJW19044.1 hypothetical protein PAV_1c00150 [Paenibacillus alvei DSM 29]MCY9753513.1 hypothetical protein [Paenibacillus alvei]
MRPKCGCGRTAEYLVYEDEQPHCEACMKEAIECSVYIMVRKPMDWGRELGRNQESNRQIGAVTK